MGTSRAGSRCSAACTPSAWWACIYGQRALIIGALNPLSFTGTYEHTAARLKPFQRLARTAEAFETVFFGTRAEADKVLAYVAKMHSRVEGKLDEDAGVTPGGLGLLGLRPEADALDDGRDRRLRPVLLRALRPPPR